MTFSKSKFNKVTSRTLWRLNSTFAYIKWNLTFHFRVPYDTQIERIRKRNGEKMLNMFIDKWIPLEEMYFKAFKVEEEADIVFDTSKE